MRTLGLLHMRGVLGVLLRQAREGAGLSLRQLESRSGVSNSEISKLESGSQDCRLESFARISAALGIPSGRLLDAVLFVDFAAYAVRINAHPSFLKITSRQADLRELLAANIAIIAAFAVQLVLSARPMDVAASVDYPGAPLRDSFHKFASQLENVMTGIDRQLLLRRFDEHPIETLAALKVFDWEALHHLIGFLISEKSADATKRKAWLGKIGLPPDSPIWFPVIDIPRLLGQRKDLTNAESSINFAPVKAQLPNLLEELKHATAAPGKKTELAKFLGAPLASVSRWLSGEREPGGETVLKMQAWLKRPT